MVSGCDSHGLVVTGMVTGWSDDCQAMLDFAKNHMCAHVQGCAGSDQGGFVSRRVDEYWRVCVCV